MHNVFLKDFNLVYDIFTADILWACFNAYSEHHALRFDLSADAVGGSPAVTCASAPKQPDEKTSQAMSGERGDLLGILLADSPANFIASGAVDPNSNSAKGVDKQGGIDTVYRDAVAKYMTLRFSRPQVRFKGPLTPLPIVQVAESMVLDIRYHSYALIHGRVKCKDSWTMSFKNVQYFSVVSLGDELSWVPYECVEFQPDGCREAVPDNVRCLSPAHELKYVTVYHYIDGHASMSHDLKVFDEFSDTSVGSKMTDYAGQDLYFYTVDSLKMSVSSKEWEAWQDVLTNLVLVTNDQLTARQHEIEAMVFRTQLTMRDETDKEREVDSLRYFVRDLQRAVQDLKRAYDLSEQLLVTLDRHSGESSGHTEHKERLNQELGRNKKLFFDARRDLRIRVMALNEYLLNPVQDGQTLNRNWNSRYEVEFGELQFVARDVQENDICDCHISSLFYVWNWHNTGFGEQQFECRKLVVFDPQRSQTEDATASCQAVIEPYTELHGGRGQDDCMVRVYSRDGASVGGIPVTEHFEVNLVPLNVNLRQTFVDAVMAFGFPSEEATENECGVDNTYEPDTDILTPTCRQSNPSTSSGLGSRSVTNRERHTPFGNEEPTMARADIIRLSSGAPQPPPREKRGARRRHSVSALEVANTPPAEGEMKAGSSAENLASEGDSNKSHHRSRSGGWNLLRTTLDTQAGFETDTGDALSSINGNEGSRPQRRGHRRSTSDVSTRNVRGAEPPMCVSGSEPTRAHSLHRTSSNSSLLQSLTGGKGDPAFEESGEHLDLDSNVGSQKSWAGDVSHKNDKKSPAQRRRGSVKRLIHRAKETSQQHSAEAQVATMKSRSQDYRTYLCFKIPSFPVRATYRRKEGDKTTILDLTNFAVRLPLLEYRNRTCTIRALAEQIISDCARHVIAAGLKTKFLGVNTAEKMESKAHVIGAITEGDAILKEEILFGSEKTKDKRDKLSERAKKKQEKKEEKARRKTLDDQEGVRVRFWYGLCIMILI